MLWNIWFDGGVICEESNGWHRLRGLRLLLWEAVISHFLSSSAPYESPLISSGLGLITSTERHGNTAEMLYLACLGRDSKFFKLPLTAPFDWQMAVWVRILGRADLWPRWRVYPVIITMSSVKQRHGKASDPERQAINQRSSHTSWIYCALTHLAVEKTR